MTSIILKIAKQLSALMQRPTDSFKRHNLSYQVAGKVDIERSISEDYFRKNLINGPTLKAIDLIKKYNIQNAIDIGSGTGWASAALSKEVKNIIAIEPSEAAITIARQLYPDSEFPNITWIQGYAEEILHTQQLLSPVIFVTGCVLTHLRDVEVLKICSAINTIAPHNSVVAFSECWGDIEWHQLMWHIRTKDWWQQALPNWTLDFHGPIHENGNCHMGFSGVKNK